MLGGKNSETCKKAQKILERRDPAYRAWRDEERTREREKDLRRQGEALQAAMASRWDDALRRCAIVPAGVPRRLFFIKKMIMSARKLVVEPPMTVDVSFCSAAFLDVSHDSHCLTSFLVIVKLIRTVARMPKDAS